MSSLHSEQSLSVVPSVFPAGGDWMELIQRQIDCPPGLECLNRTDQLLIYEDFDSSDIIGGCKTRNTFTVRNNLGEKIYSVIEDSDFWKRNRHRRDRPLDMNIFDNYGKEAIRLHRPFRCDSCCFPCCLQKMKVSLASGTVVGYVKQKWSIYDHNFTIKNDSDDTVLRLRSSTDRDAVEFKVMSVDGNVQVGKIRKQWSGPCKEVLTPGDSFAVSFAMDLDVRMKAVVLGACILIDLMFYEPSANRRNLSIYFRLSYIRSVGSSKVIVFSETFSAAFHVILILI
ncbi:Scramblase domain containing protein [Asbolus verrucosus]|uniref:Phospholipid scramblase n=1 Tax=Asbolus verrucosus TaxID=1661398 RepID=A0A482VVD6_ASBVE|nr:Scramblase domain containing protein [Asbolus verrucosus]